MEIARGDRLETVYFHIPNLEMYLTEDLKTQFLYSIDRSSPTVKLSSFLARSTELVSVIAYHHRMTEFLEDAFVPLPDWAQTRPQLVAYRLYFIHQRKRLQVPPPFCPPALPLSVASRRLHNGVCPPPPPGRAGVGRSGAGGKKDFVPASNFGALLVNSIWALSKPFFSGLDTLPQGGGVPACLFGNSGCPQRNHPPPPPVGVGQEWVGIFWGKYLQA